MEICGLTILVERVTATASSSFTLWLLQKSIEWSHPWLLIEVTILVILFFLPSHRWANAVRKVGAIFLLCYPFVSLNEGIGLSLWIWRGERSAIGTLIEPLSYTFMGFTIMVVVSIIGYFLLSWRVKKCQ
jgi:hypothetical protein